jgi:hypothetical protein
MVVRPKYVTPTAPTPEQACPILRRVRRSAKKAFHVSWGCAPGELLAGGAAGAVDACRTVLNLLGVVRRGEMEGLLRCCWSLLDRMHVENDAVAAEEGASIAGGKWFAKALAGHSALRVSITNRVSREWREVAFSDGVWRRRELSFRMFQ